MITNPSPKQRFMLVKADVDAVNNMTASAIFDKSADAALLQYQEQLHYLNTSTSEMHPDAAKYNRLLGAREFLFILRNLGQTEGKAAKPIDMINLEQKAN